MVWCGVVWCGVAWCDVVWCGVESCTGRTYAGVRANCAEMMDSYQQCLLDNPRKWKVCNGLRDSLDKCAIQNKLGEIAKM